MGAFLAHNTRLDFSFGGKEGRGGLLEMPSPPTVAQEDTPAWRYRDFVYSDQSLVEYFNEMNGNHDHKYHVARGVFAFVDMRIAIRSVRLQPRMLVHVCSLVYIGVSYGPGSVSGRVGRILRRIQNRPTSLRARQVSRQNRASCFTVELIDVSRCGPRTWGGVEYG